MNILLYDRLRSENAAVNVVWRFFSNADHQWRWQRVAFDGTVLDQSKSAYEQYEGCVADASESGYVFLASPLSTKPVSTARKTKRAYMRMPTKSPKQVPKT